jgi:hypothetical protein
MTTLTGTLHKEKHIFLIVSLSVLLRMRNILGKFGEKIKTAILCSITLFFLENHAVYEIMRDNVVQPVGHMTIWLMSIACWIPMATNRHLAYVILVAMFAKKRITVKLHVHCLSCSF